MFEIFFCYVTLLFCISRKISSFWSCESSKTSLKNLFYLLLHVYEVMLRKLMNLQNKMWERNICICISIIGQCKSDLSDEQLFTLTKKIEPGIFKLYLDCVISWRGLVIANVNWNSHVCHVLWSNRCKLLRVNYEYQIGR